MKIIFDDVEEMSDILDNIFNVYNDICPFGESILDCDHSNGLNCEDCFKRRAQCTTIERERYK